MPRRLVPVVLVATVAAAASAQPGPAVWAEPDPAAVVGRWRATSSWRGCATTGAARVVLDVGRDGSGYGLDLALVLDGLGPQVLVPFAARKLEATRDDLRVEWTAGKHNRATLVVRFASGCTGTLALTRVTTGTPSCDELVALESIASRCESVERPDIADVDRKVIAGAARPGKSRAAAARMCAHHAPPLRASLVAVGCVPVPADASAPGVRIPECEALVASVSRLARCNKVPADAKQRLLTNMQRVTTWSTLPPSQDVPENRTRMVELCEQSRIELDEVMRVMGC